MKGLSWPGPDWSRLLDRARAVRDRGGGRRVRGLAGAPGAGKSTLAPLVVDALNEKRPDSVVLVGMDAFHIGHRILAGRGQAHIKGAPETFDVHGYLTLLRRVRETDEVVYAPEFDRSIEDSIAAAVEIRPDVALVVTEGNYLLLPTEPWNRVRPLLDEAWFVHLEDEERRRRLVARRERLGDDHDAAVAWASGSDQANARLVDQAQNDPDVWIEHRVGETD